MPVLTHGVTLLVSFLQSTPGQLFFVIPLVALLADFISGIVRAAKSGTFRLAMMADFLSTHVLPYGAALVTVLVIPVLSGVPVQVAAAAASAAMLAFVAAQVGSIAENIGETFGVPQATVALVVRLALSRVFPGVQAPIETSVDTSQSPTDPSEGPAA
jgi:hypothetical protein